MDLDQDLRFDHIFQTEPKYRYRLSKYSDYLFISKFNFNTKSFNLNNKSRYVKNQNMSGKKARGERT
jgi:hypothetical protein